MFFGADDPELWKILAGMFPDLSGCGHEDGERWARDVRETVAEAPRGPVSDAGH